MWNRNRAPLSSRSSQQLGHLLWGDSVPGKWKQRSVSLSKVPGSLSRLEQIASLGCSSPAKGWDEYPTGPCPQFCALKVWLWRDGLFKASLWGWAVRQVCKGASAGILPSRSPPRGVCGVCVQAALPGSTQPHRKPWGPLLGPSNATHGHSVNSPKAGTGWERVCITPGSQEGVREAQAKWELSLKVTFYLQHPNDFCSALYAFLYFNSKTDFFFGTIFKCYWRLYSK